MPGKQSEQSPANEQAQLTFSIDPRRNVPMRFKYHLYSPYSGRRELLFMHGEAHRCYLRFGVRIIGHLLIAPITIIRWLFDQVCWTARRTLRVGTVQPPKLRTMTSTYLHRASSEISTETLPKEYSQERRVGLHRHRNQHRGGVDDYENGRRRTLVH